MLKQDHAFIIIATVVLIGIIVSIFYPIVLIFNSLFILSIFIVAGIKSDGIRTPRFLNS
jgi:hypothetical protein